ncbi:hypothetical protein [Rhodococcus koreensis]
MGAPEVIDFGAGESKGVVIRSAIGCRWFDVVRLAPDLDLCVVDEVGTFFTDALPEGAAQRIEAVSMDLGPAYVKAGACQVCGSCS